MNERISDHKYYLFIAKQFAKDSTCHSRKVGAIITRDGVPISAACNGLPERLGTCNKNGCNRSFVESGTFLEYCLGEMYHAERKAIELAYKNKNDIIGSTIYTTTKPCMECLKLIIRSGIKAIYYSYEYNNPDIERICKEKDIHLECIKID